MREVFLIGAFLLGLAWEAMAGPALRVNREQVNIRAEATAQSQRIAVLPRGTEVELLERRSEWCRVRLPDGLEGWVHGNLMQEIVVVTDDKARIRTAGSTSAPSLAVARVGEELGKVGQRGDWIEVAMADGSIGWIWGGLVRPKSIALAPSAKRAMAVPSPPSPEPEEGGAVEPESTAVLSNPYAEGLQQAIKGNYQEALENFEKVLAQDPGNLNALFNAARAHRQLGQYDQALEKLYRIMALSRGRRDLFKELGEVYRLSGRPDSADKYQALFRGEEWTSPGEATEISAPSPSPRVFDWQFGGMLWIYAAAAGAVLILVSLVLLLRRKQPPEEEEEFEEPLATGRFAQAMRQTHGRSARIDREAEAELDRQIEEKRAELRQSAEAFLGSSPMAKGIKGEEGHLEEMLTHLEKLRQALQLQEERERLYAEIVRLQNMKIEVMAQELQLLRRRART